MADSSKPPSNAAPADVSRIAKSIRSIVTPPGETARAADSVPAPGGPFATLPIKFGRYEIRKELGRGQMGAVYLAYDVELDRLVALKVARTSASGSAKLLKRMEIEARSAAKVDHPQICKVYDAGEIDGIRFIALQYIEGEDLKQYLKRKGRKREPEEAVRLVVQILRALEAAHDQGVIHRDLKPENVMLNKKRQPVIMDFGLARKTIASSDAGLTQGMIVGTAAYMSPEQATGKADAIDHRSDLYAVGVMLFEMLTGEWPFTGGAIEVMGKKVVLEPPTPLTLNPSLNPQLAVVCHKMIAKQKGDRYITCADVVAALEAVDLNANAMLAPLTEAVDPVIPLDGEPPKLDFRRESPGAMESKIRKSSPTAGQKSSNDRRTTLPPKLPSRKSGPLVTWWNSQRPWVRWTMLGGAGACLVFLTVILCLPTRNSVNTRVDGEASIDGKSVVTQNVSNEPPPAIDAAPVNEDLTPGPTIQEEIARLETILRTHNWHYHDNLFPPGDICQFHENGMFHRWNWKYWVVGPREMRIHYDRSQNDAWTGIPFYFNEDLTTFRGEWNDPGGRTHIVTGTRQ